MQNLQMWLGIALTPASQASNQPENFPPVFFQNSIERILTASLAGSWSEWDAPT
jgi:hypothetical protein